MSDQAPIEAPTVDPVGIDLAPALALIAAQAKADGARQRVQIPATVATYSAPVATVTTDDGGTLDAVSLIGAVAANDRVMVAFERPRGVFVVATY